MNRPTLIPRSYKIDQNINEYIYYVEFDHNTQKWAVALMNGATKGYLAGRGKIDAYYPDVVFNTPEDALAAWEKWYMI